MFHPRSVDHSELGRTVFGVDSSYNGVLDAGGLP